MGSEVMALNSAGEASTPRGQKILAQELSKIDVCYWFNSLEYTGHSVRQTADIGHAVVSLNRRISPNWLFPRIREHG